MKRYHLMAGVVLAITFIFIMMSYAQTGTRGQGTTPGTSSATQQRESPGSSGTQGTYSGTESATGKDKMGKTQGRMAKAEEMPSRASKIIGMTVEDAQGERLGKVEDLMIDPKSDRVIFAVVSYGGTLGMGGKYTAVPLSLMSEGNQDRLVLNVSKDKLASAPTFEKNQWPDPKDRAWTENVYRHYGQTPYWKESGQQERKKQ